MPGFCPRVCVTLYVQLSASVHSLIMADKPSLATTVPFTADVRSSVRIQKLTVQFRFPFSSVSVLISLKHPSPCKRSCHPHANSCLLCQQPGSHVQNHMTCWFSIRCFFHLHPNVPLFALQSWTHLHCFHWADCVIDAHASIISFFTLLTCTHRNCHGAGSLTRRFVFYGYFLLF